MEIEAFVCDTTNNEQSALSRGKKFEMAMITVKTNDEGVESVLTNRGLLHLESVNAKRL